MLVVVLVVTSLVVVLPHTARSQDQHQHGRLCKGTARARPSASSAIPPLRPPKSVEDSTFADSVYGGGGAIVVFVVGGGIVII